MSDVIIHIKRSYEEKFVLVSDPLLTDKPTFTQVTEFGHILGLYQDSAENLAYIYDAAWKAAFVEKMNVDSYRRINDNIQDSAQQYMDASRALDSLGVGVSVAAATLSAAAAGPIGGAVILGKVFFEIWEKAEITKASDYAAYGVFQTLEQSNSIIAEVRSIDDGFGDPTRTVVVTPEEAEEVYLMIQTASTLSSFAASLNTEYTSDTGWSRVFDTISSLLFDQVAGKVIDPDIATTSAKAIFEALKAISAKAGDKVAASFQSPPEIDSNDWTSVLRLPDKNTSAEVFTDHSSAISFETPSEGNNTGNPTLPTSLPDLELIDFSVAGSSIVSGDPIKVQYTVVNSGDASAGSSPTGLYLSRDQIADSSDILLGALLTGELAGGTSKVQQMTRSTADWGAGNFYVYLAADNDSQYYDQSTSYVYEESVLNNLSNFAPVTFAAGNEESDQEGTIGNSDGDLPPPSGSFAGDKDNDHRHDLPNGSSNTSFPDYALTFVDIDSGTLRFDQEFRVTTGYVNNGGDERGQTEIGYYLSTDERFGDNDDIFIGSDWLPRLDNGQSGDRWEDLLLSDSPKAAEIENDDYYLFSVLDHEFDLDEQDWEDNVSQPIPVRVTGVPEPVAPEPEPVPTDLAIISIHPDVNDAYSGKEGHTLAYRIDVEGDLARDIYVNWNFSPVVGGGFVDAADFDAATLPSGRKKLNAGSDGNFIVVDLPDDGIVEGTERARLYISLDGEYGDVADIKTFGYYADILVSDPENTENESGPEVTTETQTYVDGRVLVTTFVDGVRTEATMTDVADVHSWTSYTNSYDDAGERISLSYVYDNGTAAENTFVGGQRTQNVVTEADGDARTTTYGADGVRDTYVFEDLSGTSSWISYTNYYDDAGDLVLQSYVYDNGTAAENTFVGGQRTQNVVTEADGDARTTTYGADGVRDTYLFEDLSGSRSWISYTNYYDDAGDLVSRSYVYDNGTAAENTFVGGQRTQNVVTEADGDARTTTYGADGVRDTYLFEDLSGSRSWISYTNYYDDAGDLVSRSYVYDNGTAAENTFVGGQITQNVVTEADGDARTTTYGADGVRDTYLFEDLSGSRSWISYTNYYDDAGDLVSRSYVYDNGTAAENTFVGGQITQNVVTEADGDARTTTYGADGVRDTYLFEDLSGSRDWAEFTNTYDDTGTIESWTRVYDDGRVFLTEFEEGVAVSTTEVASKAEQTLSLSDDFEDGVLATDGWTYLNNVSEFDGSLHLEMLVTDQRSRATIEFEHSLNDMTLSYDAFMHAENAYFYGDNSLIFTDADGSEFTVRFNPQQTSWAPSYENNADNFDLSRMLLFDPSGDNTSVYSSGANTSSYFDEWTRIEIAFESDTGTLEIDMESDGVADLVIQDDLLVGAEADAYTFGTYGWWTGHYTKIDDLDLVGTYVVDEYVF